MEKKGCCIFDVEQFAAVTAGLELAQCMLRGKNLSSDPNSICKHQLLSISVSVPKHHLTGKLYFST